MTVRASKTAPFSHVVPVAIKTTTLLVSRIGPVHPLAESGQEVEDEAQKVEKVHKTQNPLNDGSCIILLLSL